MKEISTLFSTTGKLSVLPAIIAATVDCMHTAATKTVEDVLSSSIHVLVCEMGVLAETDQPIAITVNSAVTENPSLVGKSCSQRATIATHTIVINGAVGCKVFGARC